MPELNLIVEDEEPDFFVKVFEKINQRLAKLEDDPQLTTEQVESIVNKTVRDPVVNVEAPIVNLDSIPPDIMVPVPEVNITPEINVEAPTVNVEAPAVTVEQPNISVEAPIVTNESPVVNVRTPRIRSITFEVTERDFDDNIVNFIATPIYEED